MKKKCLDSIFDNLKKGYNYKFAEELWAYMEGTGQGVPGLDPGSNGINAAKAKKTCKNCKSLPCKCK